MEKYRVEHLGREGVTPQNYRYAIWLGPRKVGEFGHDFRNDERWLVVNGRTETVVVNFLAGGGPQPLVVSNDGVRLLDALLGFSDGHAA
jgi:hypothetical protein